MKIVYGIILSLFLAATSFSQTLPSTRPTVDSLLSSVSQPIQKQIRDSLAVAHVDPAAIPAISYVPDGDIAGIIRKYQSDNATLTFDPNGSYTFSTTTATITAKNLTLNFNGASLAVNGATAIDDRGANLTVLGANVTGNALFMRAEAPGLHVVDCHTSNLWAFCVVEHSAPGAVFTNCTGRGTVKAFIFCEADNSEYHNLSINGSRDEHCLRITGDGVNPIPTGALVDGGEWGYVPGSDKGSFAFRGVHKLIVRGAKVHGSMTGGQKTGDNTLDGIVSGCTFDYNGVDAGGQANFQSGVSLVWDNNIHLITNLRQQPVSASGSSRITLGSPSKLSVPVGYAKKFISPLGVMVGTDNTVTTTNH